MDDEKPMRSTFRRYPRQPRAKPGDLILFDGKGRMLDVSANMDFADFDTTGHVLEVDETGMLIAFTEGQEPPWRG